MMVIVMWVIGCMTFCIDQLKQKYSNDGKFYDSPHSSENNEIEENVEKRSL